MWDLTRRERIGVLMVMHLELEGQTNLMHHYQRILVGGPPCFWRNGLATSALVTVLSSILKMFLILIC